MMNLIIKNARIVTGESGKSAIPCANLHIIGNRIQTIQTDPIKIATSTQIIDAKGRLLIPGFIDAHTHAMWAGNRLDEFEQKLSGNTYLQILENGYGIMATVREVRTCSEQQLTIDLTSRLNRMLLSGTTTIEVKSGYGLTTQDELKMLRAIQQASYGFKGTVIPTALLGHAVDPEQTGFIDRVIDETLSAVHQEFPNIAVDAYCEEGAWSVNNCKRLFEYAQKLGHPIRVHADQFNSLGMVPVAIEMNALSIDHLESTKNTELIKLAQSDTYGVMLPVSSFHIDGRYANGRALVDHGGKLVLSSNYNPGSAPSFSMPFVIALAVRNLGISPLEAISACTVNAASLLGLCDRGTIAKGKRADLLLLRYMDERMLAFEIGGSPIDIIICDGKVIKGDGESLSIEA